MSHYLWNIKADCFINYRSVINILCANLCYFKYFIVLYEL